MHGAELCPCINAEIFVANVMEAIATNGAPIALDQGLDVADLLDHCLVRRQRPQLVDLGWLGRKPLDVVAIRPFPGREEGAGVAGEIATHHDEERLWQRLGDRLQAEGAQEVLEDDRPITGQRQRDTRSSQALELARLSLREGNVLRMLSKEAVPVRSALAGRRPAGCPTVKRSVLVGRLESPTAKALDQRRGPEQRAVQVREVGHIEATHEQLVQERASTPGRTDDQDRRVGEGGRFAARGEDLEAIERAVHAPACASPDDARYRGRLRSHAGAPYSEDRFAAGAPRAVLDLADDLESKAMDGRSLRLLGVANGASLNVLRWGKRLQELGHEIHIVTDQISPLEEEREGLIMHDVRDLDVLTRIKGVRRVRIGSAIASLAQRLRIDLIHAHYMLPYGYWAAQSGFHPLVMSPWSRDIFVDANERRRGRRRSLESIRAADYFVVNSQANQRASIELGANPDRVQEIVWYAEPERFHPENADPHFRAARGWPDDALVILSLRNYRPYTHVDVLVRAFAEIAPREPSARLLLCARAGWLRAEIEQLIADLGIGHLVSMERAEYDELPTYVASADIAVTLADSDSTPASLLEVMASRLPVVAAPTWSIDEWLEHGKGAEIVPVRDVDATARALRTLLHDADLREAYGAYNESLVRARMQEPGPVLEKLYRELIAEHSASRAA